MYLVKRLLPFVFSFCQLIVVGNGVDQKVTVDSMNQLSVNVREKNPTYALELAEKAIKSSQELNNYKFGLAHGFYNRGVAKMDLNMLDDARSDLDKAASIFSDLDDPFFLRVNTDRANLLQQERRYPESLALHHQNLLVALNEKSKYVPSILINMGVVHHYMGQLDSAEFYYLRTLEANREVEEKLVKDRVVKANLGIIYRRQGKLEKALSTYYEVLPMAEADTSKVHVASILNSIALVHYELHEYEKALGHHAKALKLRQELKNKQLEASSLNNMGLCHMKLGNFAKALDLFFKSLTIKREVNAEVGLSDMLNNIAITYEQLGDFEKSEKYQLEALELDMKADYQVGVVRGRNNLAKLHLNNSNPRKALEYLNENYAPAHKLDDFNGLISLYKHLAEAHMQLGSYKLSLDNLQMYNLFKDSIFNVKKSAQIEELTVRYQTAEKEKELLEQQSTIENLEAEKQLRETTLKFLGVLSFFVVAISVLLVVLLRVQGKRKREKLIREQQLTEVRLQNEKLSNETLKSQLEAKDHELRTYAEKLSQQNELVKGFTEQVKKYETEKDSIVLAELSNSIKGRSASAISWEEFRLKFDEVHGEFIPKLSQLHPELTNNELDLSMLMKINLSNKDIANILGVSYEGVKKSAQRLYKKLGYENSNELRAYFVNV